ncbi:H-type small acid-soluble spore protein [Clostridium sp. DJ247]|uniref:H-type small acid-soluble spore protein n=1 Tax=Clostridium sp. DJ247 TaxID=2726188 RepID=UPI001629D429|nr:H-type small acid-soluble spore protein [Clostridium sp. DJ247]MBC2581132.1 H-type small acid-soluble spore protein [Clostridium sp. DJ247]
MNLGRAREIMDSPANIEVLYEEHPVWLDSIDDKAGRVLVKIMDKKETVYVPVEELVDTGKVINVKG